MQLLPNVFKQSGYVREKGSIKIPDYEPIPELVHHEFEEGTEDEQAQFEESKFKQESDSVKFEPAMPTRQELYELCRSDIEIIKKQEKERAYIEAIQEKRNEIQQCMNRVDSILIDMQRVQEEYFEKFANELKYMAVDIAETVMITKIENEDLALKDLVLQSMGRIKNADWLDIQLSDQLSGLISFLHEELKRLELSGKVSLSPKPMPIDSVRVDSPIGAVDVSVTKQTDKLRDIFLEEIYN